MKKIIVRIISIVLVIIMIVTGFNIFNYVLIDDTTLYTRLMMHEFYNQDNIDILFLGASHCNTGLIPSVVSEEIGKKVFNAASLLQAPDASYAIIKEAIELYDVEEIYLEISGTMTQDVGNYKDRTVLISTYMISDYMRPSLNKVELLLGASSSDKYINGFVPARRKWELALDVQYMKSIYEKKSSDIYKNYKYDNAKYEHGWYAGNGYLAFDSYVDEHMYYTNQDGFYPLNINKISDDWKKSIDMIIDYCNKHNVKLTLYDIPISNFLLAALGNYDEYIGFIRDFIKGKDVNYVEFNLLSKEYWNYQQTYYIDADHLNMYGAGVFSHVLSNYIQGKLPQEAYCKSVTEKLNTAPSEYYGIVYNDNPKENERTIRLISNHPDVYEFKVEIAKDDGSKILLQDFSNNNEITFSKELINSGERIMITARMLLEDKTQQESIYEYYHENEFVWWGVFN